MSHDDVPPLVIWETSQACDLACPLCQTSAAPRVHASELTTKEGIRLLEQIRSFGNPWVVFTGSDPIKRPDLFLLIRKSVELGLHTSVSPSSTAFLSSDAIREFKKEGVDQMVIAMDNPVATVFDSAMEALEEASKIGLAAQVQTTVTRWTMYLLEEIACRVERSGARVWSLFLDGLNDDEFREVFETLYRIAKGASFEVRISEKEPGYAAGQTPLTDQSETRGFVFISHSGEIHPSGFLAVSAGNIHRDSIVDVYRNSSLFSILRGTYDYPIECRGCDCRSVCGGSRARAYALSGATSDC